MKIESAINMAVTAVMCDTRLPQEMKKEIIDALRETERLAEIGRATEFAFKDGAKHTVFQQDIEHLLEFYEDNIDEE